MASDIKISQDTAKWATEALKAMKRDWYLLAPRDNGSNATPIHDWLVKINKSLEELEAKRGD